MEASGAHGGSHRPKGAQEGLQGPTRAHASSQGLASRTGMHSRQGALTPNDHIGALISEHVDAAREHMHVHCTLCQQASV